MDAGPYAGVRCTPMSDQPDEGAKARRTMNASATMQIDALVDPDAVLEDSVAPEVSGDDVADASSSAGQARAPAGPPPLPRRGPSKPIVIAALVIVLVAAFGAAVFASNILAPAEPAPIAAPAPAPLPPAATPPSAPEAPAAPRRRISIEAVEIVGGSNENTVP